MYPYLAQQGQIGHMWYGNGHMAGMHWAWWIFWVAVVTVLIWVVVRTSGGSSSAGGDPPLRGGPEQILRERYANGEISEDEFRKRLQVLRESDEG